MHPREAQGQGKQLQKRLSLTVGSASWTLVCPNVKEQIKLFPWLKESRVKE